MDRQIVYPGSIPLDTDLLNVQRNVMVALGYLTQATLGQSTVADGLTCSATQPSSMAVTVGPGSLTQFGVIDTTAFGSLPALPSTPMVKVGIVLNPTNFALSAPTSAGQTISYLVQASVSEEDASPVVLPYYNAANPGVPFSGANNSGTPQMTQRLQSVELALKAGPPVNGAASLPAVDAGWIGLYAVTVACGQTSIVESNISVLPSAPFLPYKLPELSPGTLNLAVFQPATQGSWTAPVGVTAVRLRIWGGGGAGGSGLGGGGGGGAAGGYSEGFYPVSPGQSYVVTVGNGGAGSGSGGGTSSFGNLASATGGQAGGNGSSTTGGSGATIVGAGYGSAFSRGGGSGGDAFGADGSWLSGAGGAAFAGSGANSAVGLAGNSTNGKSATTPGGGGSGGVFSGTGGEGASGLVLIEW